MGRLPKSTSAAAPPPSTLFPAGQPTEWEPNDGIARVRFYPGKVEEWKRLTEEAMEIVRTRDSGTLQYEIFFNEDETEAMVFERYQELVEEE